MRLQKYGISNNELNTNLELPKYKRQEIQIYINFNVGLNVDVKEIKSLRRNIYNSHFNKSF